MDTVWWADKFPSKERDQNSQSINTHLLNNGSHYIISLAEILFILSNCSGYFLLVYNLEYVMLYVCMYVSVYLCNVITCVGLPSHRA